MDAPKISEHVVTIDVHAANDHLHSGYHYLDVRTSEEFNKSHIENAVNVPYMFITPEGILNPPGKEAQLTWAVHVARSVHQSGRVKNPEFLDQVSAICSKDDQLIVGCNSGGRSHRACVDLLNAGYVQVKNMGGGYSAWVDNGLSGNHKAADELKISCKFRP